MPVGILRVQPALNAVLPPRSVAYRRENLRHTSTTDSIITGPASNTIFRMVRSVVDSLRYDERRGLETFVYGSVQAIFTAAYILRGCRLITMYNRGFQYYRWGYLVTKERRAVFFLLGLFVAWQVLAWSAALKFGVEA